MVDAGTLLLAIPFLIWLVMKGKANGRVSNTLGWITTVLMTLAAGALLFSMLTGQ